MNFCKIVELLSPRHGECVPEPCTHRPSSSKYKGVSIHKRSGKWQASIKYNGIHKSLGSYETEEEAERAGSKGAKEQKSGTEPLLRKKTTLRTVGKFFTGG